MKIWFHLLYTCIVKKNHLLAIYHFIFIRTDFFCSHCRKLHISLLVSIKILSICSKACFKLHDCYFLGNCDFQTWFGVYFQFPSTKWQHLCGVHYFVVSIFFCVDACHALSHQKNQAVVLIFSLKQTLIWCCSVLSLVSVYFTDKAHHRKLNCAWNRFCIFFKQMHIEIKRIYFYMANKCTIDNWKKNYGLHKISLLGCFSLKFPCHLFSWSSSSSSSSSCFFGSFFVLSFFYPLCQIWSIWTKINRKVHTI